MGKNKAPILFNTPMVRAILDGRKTVTRRVVKPQHLRVLDSLYHKEHPDVPDKAMLARLCEPPCRPGDILWVRETWFKLAAGDYAYKADANSNSEKLRVEFGYKWRPSIHMPREAARIWLRVTDVRVERLCEIDESGARAEGAEPLMVRPTGSDKWYEWGPARPNFIDIWNSTIKPADRKLYGWAANPWVWVIAFERTERPVTPT